MNNLIEQQRLISHAVTPEKIDVAVQEIAARIRQQGDTSFATVARQLELLEQLSQFEFGRFLIQNKGINGYWTHYMLTHPWFGRKTGKSSDGSPLTELENFVLNRAPLMLATQQRFLIFLHENQKAVKNHAKLASVPSGLLGEILYLDFANIETISLIGIDYDKTTLSDAALLAEKLNLSRFVNLLQEDAWNLSAVNEYDLISSNGLSIYEPDDNKVVKLYQQFYQALKPGGKLVTSILTPPPSHTAQCEWNMQKINLEDLMLQKTIFVDMLNAKFQCYRTTHTAKKQLEAAGFQHIEFINDDANIFSTIVAYKK